MKGFLKFILSLLIIVVILIAGVYAAVSIPKKKVEVAWTQADVQSYMQKAKSNIVAGSSAGDGSTVKPASLEDLLFNNFIAEGQVDVEGVLTSSEITAMANTVIRGQGIFKDIRMSCRDDGTIESSAYLGDGIKKIVNLFPEAKKYENVIKLAEGKPIYWRFSLERLGEKQFTGHTEELYVGQVPVPLPQAAPGLTEAGSAVNNMIAKIDGFSCESFDIDSQGMHFKGKIPDKLAYADPQNLLNK